MSAFDDPVVLERFADLAVGFAANVQPGQVVAVDSETGKEPLTRAIAASAYRHGARFVDVQYFDQHVKRARILHAAGDELGYVPPWYGDRIRSLTDARGARIMLRGPVDPTAMNGVDPRRAGRDQLPSLVEHGRLANERIVNWTIVAAPTRGWATLVHPELEPAAAWTRLGEQLVHVCALDEADPVAAWRDRAAALASAAERLTARRFAALHFAGEGTDLTVGLLPSSTWVGGLKRSVDGLRFLSNLPTEEVFTGPDPTRAEGVVRATKPLVLGGSIIRGLELEFAAGRAVRIDAAEGADVLRGYAARDPGAARLGELALVDGSGRIGPLDTVFFESLLDENAASHLALGRGYAFTVAPDDVGRLNDSQVHVDFMIGGPDVDVDGVTSTGDRVPVLRDGVWQV